ncbi:putative Mobilization protein MbeC [Enhydrobacter sp. 8BJ]|nr:plasmid mobilization relaxosome protein MobC [Enhydrobacter sp. 8BJ]VXB25560.1 putative Mobilization protein MbeC [Enhydrobacter sp. 8BJ]
MAKITRSKRLNIRFSEAEFEKVQAKAQGINLARYARAVLTEGEPPKRQKDYPKIDPQLMQQLVAMGNNLNQLVRYTHTQAGAGQTIDFINLALSLDQLRHSLDMLKQHYQLPNDTIAPIEEQA